MPMPPPPRPLRCRAGSLAARVAALTSLTLALGACPAEQSASTARPGTGGTTSPSAASSGGVTGGAGNSTSANGGRSGSAGSGMSPNDAMNAGGAPGADASRTDDVGPPPSPPDAARDQAGNGDTLTPPSMPPPTGQRVLLHTLRNMGYRHESAEPASRVLRDKLMGLGFVAEIGMDAAVFTDQGLAPYKVIVMVQASGEPLGSSPTAMEALAKFVRSGGGLVGFHAATDLVYANNSPYVALIGGKFIGHPGDIRTAPCESTGTHASIARLPKPFTIQDEIYTFAALNPGNQIVLHCAASGGGAPVPIAWHRNEGTGRVFYTGLGHRSELWTATSPLVNDHVLPGILWAAGR